MSKAIHLCIDFQVYLQERFPTESWRTLRKNIENLTSNLEQLGIQTVFVGYIPPEVCFGSRQWAAKIFDRYDKVEPRIPQKLFNFDLEIAPNNLVALKGDPATSTNGKLLRYISKRGIRKIILSGLYEAEGYATENDCVTETASDLSYCGYNVCIAAEATNCFVPHVDESEQGLQFPLSLSDRRALHQKIHEGKQAAPLGSIQILEMAEILHAVAPRIQPHSSSKSKRSVNKNNSKLET